MVQMSAFDFFEEYLDKPSLFKNPDALTLKFNPDNIPHRDKEINLIAQILAPALKQVKPSNIFIYGKPGTGKTLVVKNVLKNMEKISGSKNIPLKLIYLNCKMQNVADTEYRVVAQISREFGKDVPITGLPTNEVYNEFFSVVDDTKQVVILVLDEIDVLINKCGDNILYNLTRINENLNNAVLSIIGISNDVNFKNNLEPRVKSSLGEEEIIFNPYDALQLKEILHQRAELAFNESSFDPLVIAKCAAYAAQQHGDARRAIALFRVAGELAERANKILSEEFVDMAEKQLEKDTVMELVKNLTLQSKLVFYSIISSLKNRVTPAFTGEIFEFYNHICNRNGLDVLTQRRLSDLIGELDMLGLINAKVISKGRYGRTREISLAVDADYVNKISIWLEDDLELK
ncbi:MAG: orc1/cdc6 family replication initiation protein [Nanoarchaeota archaeon]|nr:orc1/cdc6 family replication initiation protein [Nanoarchaeota archaeon]